MQTSCRPRIKVVLNSDGAIASSSLSDGDILIEGRRAYDGRFVDALVFPYSIGASVTGDRPLLRAACADSNIGLHNVVLNKWVRGPSVDGKTAKTASHIESARMSNGTVIFNVVILGLASESIYDE